MCHLDPNQQKVIFELPALRKQAQFNGRALVIGFRRGGPYAILGPKRMGYDAGIACHGTQRLNFVDELEGIRRSVSVLWGNRDQWVPARVLEACRDSRARIKRVQAHVFPGVQHGYMMRSTTRVFDESSCRFSMAHAFNILELLRRKPERCRIDNAGNPDLRAHRDTLSWWPPSSPPCA
jgi:carboxymethylenebutenolidase